MFQRKTTTRSKQLTAFYNVADKNGHVTVIAMGVAKLLT